MGKKVLKRGELIEAGRLALDQAVERLQGRYTSKPDRLALMRITAQLITSLSDVMKESQIDEIEKRLTRLEEASKK